MCVSIVRLSYYLVSLPLKVFYWPVQHVFINLLVSLKHLLTSNCRCINLTGNGFCHLSTVSKSGFWLADTPGEWCHHIAGIWQYPMALMKQYKIPFTGLYFHHVHRKSRDRQRERERLNKRTMYKGRGERYCFCSSTLLSKRHNCNNERGGVNWQTTPALSQLQRGAPIRIALVLTCFIWFKVVWPMRRDRDRPERWFGPEGMEVRLEGLKPGLSSSEWVSVG